MNTELLFDDMMTEKGLEFAQKALAGKRIVIADDNGGILKWLKYTLQDYGAVVNVFKHGQDTIDFLMDKNNKTDVLILDLIMNNLGGLEVAKANKRLSQPAFVIFITGCTPDKSLYAEAEKIGIVIQKPVGVFKIIKEIIAGSTTFAQDHN